jgi:PmbA protein
VGDLQLISGSSLYQQRVNQPIASSRLSIRSRFDGAGVSSFSEDGYQLQPLTLIEHGVLKQLLPSRYGSLKTGLAHVPSAYGWEIAGGEDRLQDILSSVTRGALVGRLSMGSPAANGDFSGVIKNSFLLQDGQRGEALSEVMITGNVARMLEHIEAISRERMDTGATLLPWFKISGLHFS